MLSDPNKRQRYEEFGEDMGPAQSQRRHSDFENEFEGEELCLEVLYIIFVYFRELAIDLVLFV